MMDQICLLNRTSLISCHWFRMAKQYNNKMRGKEAKAHTAVSGVCQSKNCRKYCENWPIFEMCSFSRFHYWSLIKIQQIPTSLNNKIISVEFSSPLYKLIKGDVEKGAITTNKRDRDRDRNLNIKIIHRTTICILAFKTFTESFHSNHNSN
jgi:hypothetical protein